VTRAIFAGFINPDNPKPKVIPADDVLTLDGKPYGGKNEFAPVHYGMNWGGGHKGFGDDFIKEKGTLRGVLIPVPVAGPAGMTQNISFAHITDGTSYTLAIAEKRDGSGWAVGGFGGSEFDVHTSPLYVGDDANAKRVFSGCPKAEHINVLFGDGSVRALKPTLAKRIWYAMMTRDGGEMIDAKELDK
jgi:prepilin-type processing-associated H-X9-DG protein